MFANRFTAFVDACVLASPLKRNLLLTLVEAEFFRVRWSAQVLTGTQNAIEKMLTEKRAEDASQSAARARKAMEDAFEEAMVNDFDNSCALATAFPIPATLMSLRRR
ncbi:hypothetical protein [Methylocella silvestris]|uniref:hypothetical protein n=1 Tax=Methylocella silvestris TaxID=199596 RepID=UPI001FE00024|nr:hypothetical protein [Methylocella silvestris]